MFDSIDDVIRELRSWSDVLREAAAEDEAPVYRSSCLIAYGKSHEFLISLLELRDVIHRLDSDAGRPPWESTLGGR